MGFFFIKSFCDPRKPHLYLVLLKINASKGFPEFMGWSQGPIPGVFVFK